MGKSLETESGLVCGCWGQGKWGGITNGSSLWDDESVLELGTGDGYAIV